MPLTDKQKRFVEEYLVDLNATQAAIRAGYSEKTAEQQAYQLLQKTSVSEAIAAAQAAAGLPRELFEGLAAVYAALAETSLGREAPESIAPDVALEDVLAALRP